MQRLQCYSKRTRIEDSRTHKQIHTKLQGLRQLQRHHMIVMKKKMRTHWLMYHSYDNLPIFTVFPEDINATCVMHRSAVRGHIHNHRNSDSQEEVRYSKQTAQSGGHLRAGSLYGQKCKCLIVHWWNSQSNVLDYHYQMPFLVKLQPLQ